MSYLRYGHSEGHTDLCYSEDFKDIITCGSEGDVRIWNSVEDADPKDTCVGERAWAIFQKGSNLYVATDTNLVQAYTFPELETDGIITRFTAPATQIDVSPDGKKLVASSCDMNIHVVDITSMECKKVVGHRAPVLSVSIDPKQEFLASSSCDGTVRVWSLSSLAEVNQWAGLLPKTNSFEASPTLCRLQFEPISGSSLAIPEGDSIRLYKRDVWTLLQTLSINNPPETVSVVRFSPCGKLVAGGCSSGAIYVWSLATGTILARHSNPGPIVCGIAWSAASLSLSFVNYAGQLGSLVVSKTVPNNQQDDPQAVDPGDIPLAEPEFEEDDEDDDNVISLGKIKADIGFDENGEFIPKGHIPADVDDEDKESIAESVVATRVSTAISELQPPFQPSSTPVHLQQRFMVWNDVGIVRQFNMEEVNDIDIEFHDSSHHHGIRMNNLLGHSLAALTSTHLVLAAPKLEDMPSKVVCLVLNSWDGQKEWDLCLGPDEDALLVAGGASWTAVATDTPYLRIFSTDGSQTDILSIPGPLLSMVGHGSSLAVVFHSGMGSHGDQHISVAEIKITPRTRLATVTAIRPLPVSKCSGLRWVGYTDEGSLATLDTLGVLRVLYRQTWRPVCALDRQCKSEFDHYFVVGVSEMSQNVRCILCKGAFYPPVVPKPLVTEVKWQVPLCELEADKSSLEEELLRSIITVPHLSEDDERTYDGKIKIEKSISVVIMKLFALAARSGLDARALALCESMPSVDVVKLAAKYAAKLGKHQLAEKVSDVASRMSVVSYQPPPVEEEEEEEEQIPEATAESQKENYSQDLFEDSQKRENLILKMKKKKAALSPKPMRIRRLDNPFKKSRDTNNTASSEEADESRVSFMDWYSENKSQLQSDFPLLKESELAMAGMKQYRTERQQQSANGESTTRKDCSKKDTSPPVSVETETKKRKNSPQTESAPKRKLNIGSASSKLKNFSFTKK